MSKTRLTEVFETVQKQVRNKVRKSLQTLQPSADEQQKMEKNAIPSADKNSLKDRHLKPSEKVIAVEKENAPVVRRSKRKVAVSDVLSAEKPVPKLETKKSSSRSLKEKPNKPVSKSKKGGRTATKKSEQKSTLNQTTLNFSPVPLNSTITKTVDDVFESKDESGENALLTSLSSGIPVDSGLDPGAGTSELNTPCSSNESPAVNNAIRYDNESYILAVDSPPLSYWRDLAEQRRIALDKALHENELLYDQLAVLEAENSQLKQVVKEAQDLAQIVQGIIQ